MLKQYDIYKMENETMIIDCIADLHGFQPKLDGGDLLIVAGDLTKSDTKAQYDEFVEWVLLQDYEKIIIVAGNHDYLLQEEVVKIDDYSNDRLIYLCDSATEYKGITFWGSPWTPIFKGVNPLCAAFMKVDEKLFDFWNLIPRDTDVLITHGPPYGICDGVPMKYCDDGTLHHCGSTSLYKYLKYVERPRYHIFGHIHEAFGIDEHFASHDGMMQSINCSYVNGHYRPVNHAIRIEI